MPEHLEIKIKVFIKLDEVAEDHTIVASSTSSIHGSISASTFTDKLKHHNNCVVCHPVSCFQLDTVRITELTMYLRIDSLIFIVTF